MTSVLSVVENKKLICLNEDFDSGYKTVDRKLKSLDMLIEYLQIDITLA